MGARDDIFWADFLGVDPSTWTEVGVSVHPHSGLAGYCGFWCFRRGQRTVLSAPDAWIPRLVEIVREATGDDLLSPSFWMDTLASACERTVGPAYQGCLEPERFVRRSSPSVRPIDEHDEPAVQELQTACGADWNMPDEATHWRHASFDDGVMTSLAGYRAWSDDAGDPCVITRPGARSGGRGAAVTSAVVECALEADKTLLYQTLEANEPAVRIARSLGYDRYATHLAVRLTRDAPNS